ncbi:hypothetical protein Droror1_Dr00008821 [Drosera rotundifolia]
MAMLAFNAFITKILSSISGGSRSMFSRRQNVIALLLVASQKTLPVTVAIVDQLASALDAADDFDVSGGSDIVNWGCGVMVSSVLLVFGVRLVLVWLLQGFRGCLM